MEATSKLRIAAFLAIVLTTVAASTAAQGIAHKKRDPEKLTTSPDSARSRTSSLGMRSMPVEGQSSPTAAARTTPDQASNRSNPISRLRGRILFHRYTNYDAWDGRLYLYDFTTKRLRCLSERWDIDHAINGNFSPDGKQIVFMGVPRGQHQGNAWDVYLWKVDSREPPVNLTRELGTRDEDPRFAPDGRRIVFKRDGELRIMDLASRQIQSIPFGGVRAERSMPMFTRDGSRIIYTEGARKDSDLFSVDVADGTRRPLAIEAELQEYFPVPLDDSRFLYVRWTSPADHHDQVWVGSLDGRTRRPLPFNMAGSETADPFPVDDRLVVFSSTRRGGQGGYDLYLGDSDNGSSWSLSSLGVNSGQDELGATFNRGPAGK